MSINLTIYHHDDCFNHDPGPAHPESPARLQAILRALKASPRLSDALYVDALLGTDEQVMLAHTESYLQLVKQHSPLTGSYSLDPDTILSPGSLQAAMRAVGAACMAAEDIMLGKTEHGFCLTRPPGHHATSNKAMGFCIFNHLAIAALHLQQNLKVDKIAIVDFDVHHGNGTQDIMKGRAGLHYVSTHQSPHYPGSGSSKENIAGNITNFPLFSGLNDEAYQALFSEKVLPALEAEKPQFLLVSAGFDAHLYDPLASLTLTEDSYYWLGKKLKAFANKYCEGRILSVLEGGYNLEVLGSSVEAYLAGTV